MNKIFTRLSLPSLLFGMAIMLIVVAACGFAPMSANNNDQPNFDQQAQGLTVEKLAIDGGSGVGSSEILLYTWHDNKLGHSVSMRCISMRGWQESSLSCDWSTVK